MAKLYWTKEVKNILDKKIHELVDRLIDDPEISPEADADMLASIRTCKMFANDVIEYLIEEDRKDDEYQAELKRQREEEAAKKEASDDKG